MSAPFIVRYLLRFAHCDPAGIAYYPRYFELCDAAVEDWSEAVLNVSRRQLHLELGLALPTVSLEAIFSRPSRLGDLLDFAITVDEIGRTSVTMTIRVTCNGEERFSVRSKQVLTDMNKQCALPWPSEWRARLPEQSQTKKAVR